MDKIIIHCAFIAIISNKFENLKYILSFSPKLNLDEKYNHTGRNMLYEAVSYGHFEMVKFLLEHKKMNPLKKCSSYGNDEEGILSHALCSENNKLIGYLMQNKDILKNTISEIINTGKTLGIIYLMKENTPDELGKLTKTEDIYYLFDILGKHINVAKPYVDDWNAVNIDGNNALHLFVKDFCSSLKARGFPWQKPVDRSTTQEFIKHQESLVKKIKLSI